MRKNYQDQLGLVKGSLALGSVVIPMLLKSSLVSAQPQSFEFSRNSAVKQMVMPSAGSKTFTAGTAIHFCYQRPERRLLLCSGIHRSRTKREVWLAPGSIGLG